MKFVKAALAFLLLAGTAHAQGIGGNGGGGIGGNQSAAQQLLNQSLNLGTGTLTAANGAFSGTLQDTQTADTYIVTGNPRNVLMSTTLTPSANTNTIWENDNSFVYLNGPGQQNGEVNGFHSYFQVNAGAYANQFESFEASNLITGTLVGGAGYLSNFTNDTSGLTAQFTGLVLNYANNNPTANSVSGYNGILINAFTGTKPTNSNSVYAFVVKEPTASISSLGGAWIGSIGQAPAGSLIVTAPDNSGGDYFFQLQNHSGTALYQINATGGWIIWNGTGNSFSATCSGTPTSSFATTNGIVTHC